MEVFQVLTTSRKSGGMLEIPPLPAGSHVKEAKMVSCFCFFSMLVCSDGLGSSVDKTFSLGRCGQSGEEEP